MKALPGGMRLNTYRNSVDAKSLFELRKVTTNFEKELSAHEEPRSYQMLLIDIGESQQRLKV